MCRVLLYSKAILLKIVDSNVARKQYLISEKLHQVGWRPLRKCNATGVLLGKIKFKMGMVVTPKGSLIFGACIGLN